ncbi:MAG: hypothetical protein DRJ56_04240 [Thermoprotei archaeon]|nr:MAG: hypothetical protein DRJ56_04240 [Thermoprotei archaeon]
MTLLALAALAAILSGSLCGVLGYYIQRFGIVTLSFSVAHAALAGAALSLVLGADASYLALATAVSFALVLGALSPRAPRERELVSMGFFSLFNALAILMVYLSNVYVLSSATVAVVLWGSILAVTRAKLLVLLGVSALFLTYLTTFRSQIDAIVFDRRLAEAEGINVRLHTLAMLLFAGGAIALTLKLTGGFLVFTLLYNPVASAAKLARSARGQLLLSPLIGSASALSGLATSYAFDLPVGASIALVSSGVLLMSYLVRAFADRRTMSRLARGAG